MVKTHRTHRKRRSRSRSHRSFTTEYLVSGKTSWVLEDVLILQHSNLVREYNSPNLEHNSENESKGKSEHNHEHTPDVLNAELESSNLTLRNVSVDSILNADEDNITVVSTNSAAVSTNLSMVATDTSPVKHTVVISSDEEDTTTSVVADTLVGASHDSTICHITGAVEGTTDLTYCTTTTTRRVITTTPVYTNSEAPQIKRHKCNRCDKTFQLRYRWSKHKLTHPMVKPYTLRTHHHCSVHGTVLFQCSHCDRGFTHGEKLNRHMKMHSSMREKLFPCSFCDKGFGDVVSFERHHHRHKNQDPQLQQQQQQQQQQQKQQKRKHMLPQVSSEEKQFTCSQCDKTFRDILNYEKHQHRHNVAKFYECESCGLRFPLSTHASNHKCTSSRSHKCDRCDKSFSSIQHLQIHINRAHSIITGKPHKCNSCDKSFSSHTQLEHHCIARHATGVKRKFLCEQCDRTFHTDCMLIMHSRSHAVMKRQNTVLKAHTPANGH